MYTSLGLERSSRVGGGRGVGGEAVQTDHSPTFEAKNSATGGESLNNNNHAS